MAKSKALADEKFNAAKTTIPLFDKVINTVGKGKNAGYEYFLLYLQCFPKPSYLRCIRDRVKCKAVLNQEYKQEGHESLT